MSKILVIDDENTILENIKFVLELDDYEVLTAPGGEEGIRLFKENQDTIDAVISDMKMPRISGMEVLKEIKKIMPEMSVIVLTGHGDMENAILAMKAGAFEYLKKPVNADDLTFAINNAVSRKNLLAENTRMQRKILEHSEYLQGLHDSAQKILMNLIPEKLPVIPGFDFSVEFKSSEAVGGDMYDVYDMGNFLCFYVFDVSSHGILSAVITVILKSFIRNVEYNYKHGINKKKLAEIVSELNLELYANTAQNVFATLFMGFLEKKTGKLYYASAGHITQYVYNKEGITSLPSTGTVLGVFEDAAYTCGNLQLKAGDKILLFTDGVTEAPSGDDIYGCEKLLSLISERGGEPIDCTVKAMMDAVTEYSSGNFLDDITILGIELTDPQPGA